MVDIEPYQYQKTTNIKEHNDIVAKINEIVDVINSSGADTLGPRIDKLETDVSVIDSAVKIQYQDIASIKDKDQAQDNNIGTLDAQVKGITESLVSGINVIDGTTTGKFKVRLDREKAPSINSNDYDLQKATSIELVQGSGPSMLKAQITLSDGTTLISDDFLFTTEAIGTDVYISSFVFKNGNVGGTISADIGLSNGSTLEANNFVVPMDPSLLNTVQDLSTRLTAVEGGSVAGFKELEAQVNTNKTNIATLITEIDDLDIKKADQSNTNQEIVAGTITATNITKGGANVATTNDIPDISGKADLNNPSQTIIAGTINATNINKNGVAVATTNDIPNINGKVDKAQGESNAGKVLGINASGNVEPVIVSSGEVWEEIIVNNIPTNWKIGDRVKFCIKYTATFSTQNVPTSTFIEIVLTDTVYQPKSLISYESGTYFSLWTVYPYTDWNTGKFFQLAQVGTGNSVDVKRNNAPSIIYQMWRLKK